MLPKRAPRPAASGAIRAKYAIVGGGYTGLAVARRLRELDADGEIVVLEGSTVGEGSSARNSGFLSPVDVRLGVAVGEVERSRQLNRFAGEGFAYLTQEVDRAGIDCGLIRAPRITAGATDRGVEYVRKTAAGAAALGVEHRMLDAAALRETMGTTYFKEGVRVEEGHQLQPAALIRGLADALPNSVRLYENSPVLDMETGKPARLRTRDASIEADIVIFATNAAIRHFGHWRANLVTIHTYAAITEAMSEADAAHLGAARWGSLPAHRLGVTMRRIGADRFMVRSLYAYENPLDPAHVRERLADCFRRRYPALAHVKLEHVWGGVTALTWNGSPKWGRIAPNVYGSAGCNGAGIVKGTVLGKRLAEMIVTGDPQNDLRAAYGEADYIAPEPFRSIGFHVISALERRKAGAER